jgi:hypothetical protein
LVHVLWAAILAYVVVECATDLFTYENTHDPNGKFNVDAGERLWLFALLYLLLAPATLIDAVVGVCVWRYYRVREKHLSIGWIIITCMTSLVLLLLIVHFII